MTRWRSQVRALYRPLQKNTRRPRFAPAHVRQNGPKAADEDGTFCFPILLEALPTIYLARHGETAWSLTGQHTGRTDLPLTARGERNARRLGERLAGLTFVRVLSSPLQRASRTCELAGFGKVAQIDENLLEWDYGRYDGLTSAQIHAANPNWNLFRDGCPGGETPQQVSARADCMIECVRALHGDMLLFSSGHLLRVLAARWLGLAPVAGGYFLFDTASLSALGYDHNQSQPAIRLWNDTRHVGP